MRHASSRFTLEVYTQAKVKAKREAQQQIVEMMLPDEGLVEIRLQRKDPPEILVDAQQLKTRLRWQMVSFGATENACRTAKSLKGLVGAWGFEPQTPTVSSALGPVTLFKSTSTKFAQ